MRIALLMLMFCLAASGCRINPSAEREIALLRAEILDLEDQYYMLKSQRDTAVSRLRDCQGADFRAADFDDGYSLDGECVGCRPGGVDYDDASEIIYDAPSDLQSPASSDPAPVGRSQGQGSGSRATQESEPSFEEIPADSDSGSDSRSNSPIRNQVTRMVINPNFSGGQDLNGSPGDEGLSLLIQPTDRAGRVVKTSGQLTVRIVEQQSLASDRQIGQWEFSPQEIESFLVRDDVPEQGILLHLPWDKQIPRSRRIRVSLTLVTTDQRNLEASLPLTIQPPPANYSPDDSIVAAWIEQDERWMNLDSPETMADDILDQELPVQSARTEDTIDVPQWRPVR